MCFVACACLFLEVLHTCAGEVAKVVCGALFRLRQPASPSPPLSASITPSSSSLLHSSLSLSLWSLTLYRLCLLHRRSPPPPAGPTSTIVTVPASAVSDCDTPAAVCINLLPSTRPGAECSMRLTRASATVVSGGLQPNVDAVPLSASAVRPSASLRSPVVQGHTVPTPSATGVHDEKACFKAI